MRVGRALAGLSAILCLGLGLASCSYASRAVIRNASGADVLLWPLSERPVTLKAGDGGTRFVYSGYKREEALIERGGCLHTYPAPDYSGLPKRLKNANAQVVVVINADMTLSIRERSKKGVEGPEIAAPGLPLKPTTFCGRRGEG
jgi:hypothetical protein